MKRRTQGSSDAAGDAPSASFIADGKKVDDLSPEHLKWLVDARFATQTASLRLMNLLQNNPDRFKNTGSAKTVQLLVCVSFSLWRSVFLADRTGSRSLVIGDAIRFLGKTLTDNAIGYVQDRGMREWSFNFYVNCAKDNLLLLATKWPSITTAIEAKPIVHVSYKPPQRRWDRFQLAFVVALDQFEAALADPKRKII